MKTALFWILGLAASLGAHAALFAFLALATKPAPLDAQPQASGKIKMTSYEVPQSKAAPQDTKGDNQSAETASGQAAAQGPVPSQTAAAQPLTQPLQAPESATGTRSAPLPTDNTRIAEIINDTVVEPASTSGAPIPAQRAEGAQAKARPAPAERLNAKAAPPATATSAPAATAVAANPAPPPVAARAPTATISASLSVVQPRQAAIKTTAATLAPRPPRTTRPNAAPLPDTVLAVTAALGTAIGATAPNPGPVAASPLVTINAAQVSDATLARTAKAPPATAATARRPAPPRTAAAPLNAPMVSAATGWSGTATSFDPASLAAVQSFMRPLDTATGPSPRDGIAEILAQVPCSRLAATFIPETGTLELRGHVPDSSARQRVLAAIRAQLGASIPVEASMVILPSPQCDVLSRLDTLGLPQSTKQVDDPKQMGAKVQLTTFNYSDGERVVIKMKSYDFAAYVYVDYFDVDGRVLHLRPNQWEPLQYYQPGSNIVVGETEDGQPTINLTVAPPFGRELAVAYASSEPLYEGLRDTIEPAGPYLDFLRSRIAQLRAENPDYKGDWVYMFIETSP